MTNQIQIVTDELEQAVKIAKAANNAITEATELLNAVTVHEDWQCPQRSAIIETTVAVHADASHLQGDADQFYQNILYSAQEFQKAEQEINNAINEMEGLLSEYLSLVPVISSGGGGGHQFGGNGQETKTDHSLWEEIGKAAGPISKVNFGNIVDFQSIKDSIKSTEK